MKKIKFIPLFMLLTVSTAIVRAQVIVSAPLSTFNASAQVIERFMNMAISKSQSRLTHGQNQKMTFQIKVMNPGNTANTGVNAGTVRNNGGWYVAYGEATVPVNIVNGKAVFPETKKSDNPKMITLPGVLANGSVNYWFSDRGWNISEVQKEARCTPAGNGGGIFNSNIYDAPFSKQGKETGEFGYSRSTISTTLDLFKAWKWRVTKAVNVGDMLYGELNNRTYTFSISYGAASSGAVN